MKGAVSAMSKSIISNERECFICKNTLSLHKHHIMNGSDRKNAEQDGLWVYLCPQCHNMSDHAVHFNREADLRLKRIAQTEYEKTHTREQFMKRYRRNYLDD